MGRGRRPPRRDDQRSAGGRGSRLPCPGRRGPRPHPAHREDRRQRQARARARIAHPLLRGQGSARRRPRCAHRGRGRLLVPRAHQRLRRAQPELGGRHPGPHLRPHQPHRHLPHRGRELRRSHRSVLPAHARHRQGHRSEPRRGRLRPVPRPSLRDAGRGAHGRDPRRRPRRHVHHTRGHRRTSGRSRTHGHLSGDQPRRRHPGDPALPRRSHRSRGRRRSAHLAAAGRHRREALRKDTMTRVSDRFTNGFDAEVVRAWIADDPDPQTATTLEHILTQAEAGDEAAIADLEDRFSGPLVFGTAGLRGEIAAGPNRMNRAVVIRAAAGLAAFLGDTVGEGFRVVIGCDARYKSAEFAADTAAVVTAAGDTAIQLPEQLPTPLLAFALNHLGADAGVMVTASHNPPADNGYKVYLGERPLSAIESDQAAAEAGAGAQIVSPADALIAERIAAVESVASVPRAESGWDHLDEGIVETYLDRIDALGVRAESELSIVLTSLHGVGASVAEAALARTGFDTVHPVASQQAPDPDFPTLTFPNPEEAGALDASYELAREVGAELIIADDPDADGFSAAIAPPSPATGYRQLSGDEVGLLLGEDA